MLLRFPKYSSTSVDALLYTVAAEILYWKGAIKSCKKSEQVVVQVTQLP